MENIFTLGGVPVHPLVVHLAVVAVPVAALGAIVLALLPRLANRWVVPTFITALLGALGAILAKVSGEPLAEAKNLSEHAEPLADHARFGDLACISAILLAGLLLVFMLTVKKAQLYSFLSSPKLLLAVRLLTVVLALTSIVTVVMAGHEGAVLVWTEED
ncbi:MAG: hypothetical protein Q4C74_06850 [Rothia sp. (in: high G+C Gram-positive bacteria)]|nr:hypothetical protein [Rothia sp. (in: high G+C Gram-positive bacteria)]